MTAEPALKIESREDLVYFLGQACEIEHGLMCEYLYAQFSLKRSVEEGLTPEQFARVQVWEASLIDVIKQEMLHLALGTNIPTAIGAAPTSSAPTFRFCLAGIRRASSWRCSLSVKRRFAISYTWSDPRG